ncbi:hypothetical protein JYK02_36625 [Corallococcus macrosporus]|uniref:Hyalin n=1 Tax=Corallococcus macrosporus TaxID=35 RepID=A0ABS3DNY6_9BACT|nr:ELWxxDGT repeat protein [Corallococcus macrosporus]MBN8233054.1 hypothetical protein [Corallococcus macrosporus]
MSVKSPLRTLAVFLLTLGTNTGCESPTPASGTDPLPTVEGPTGPVDPGPLPQEPVEEDPGPVAQQPPPVKEEPPPVQEEPPPLEEEDDADVARPFLVKDLSPGVRPGLPHVRLDGRAQLGAYTYFAADDGIHGWELWRTDGTPEGTSLVTDLLPGREGSDPSPLVRMGDSLYFTARMRPGVSAEYDLYALWRTDGTAAGTRRLVTLMRHAWDVTVRDGRLFFRASPQDDFFGMDPSLWSTDGTPEGTVNLGRGPHPPTPPEPTVTQDPALMPAPGASSFGWNSEAVDVDGTLFFTTQPDAQDGGLWKSDGTPEGTTRVEIKAEATFEHRPRNLAALNGGVLFLEEDWRDQNSLWWLERGATEARRLGKVAQAREGEGLSFASSGTRAWFIQGAPWQWSTQELWTTDGTVEGTVRLAPAGNPLFQAARLLTPVGDTLYFVSDEGEGSTYGALWKSDGTSKGTVRVQSFRENAGRWADVLAIYPAGSRMFLLVLKETGYEVWLREGTSETARFVAPLPYDFNYHFRNEAAVVGDTLFLSCPHSFFSGSLLWKTDGHDSGPVRGLASQPFHLTAHGDRVLFWTTDAEGGYELWQSDGTLVGTTPVRDAAPGAAGSVAFPVPLVPLRPGGPLLFAASDGASGLELWKTDGTALGTKRLVDGVPGVRSSAPANLTVAGDHLFFSAWTPESGRELWALPRQAPGAETSP